MDYLSLKIKSAPRIEATPELHKRIMRRAFYEQFRYPLWILCGIAALRLAADAWLILNHSFTKVVAALASNYGMNAGGMVQISTSVFAKATLHPDLIATLIIDFGLFSYIVYMMSVVKGGKRKMKSDKFNLNPIVWFRYLGRISRIAK